MKASSKFVVRDFPNFLNITNMVCKESPIAKEKEISFATKKFTTIENLDIVHIDLSGPTKTRGFYGEMYFMIFYFYFTRMIRITFLKDKSKELMNFKVFNSKVENELVINIKFFRSSKCAQFTLNELDNFCEDNGIKR